MLFNSLEFLIFLPIVFLLYWFLFNKNLRSQNLLLLLASYFFYGWWSWKFLILLIASTLLDYLYGFGVASVNRQKSKLFLWLSIINNLGVLGIFKYYNFFAGEFQKDIGLIGIHISPLFLNIALPVGISFYTFHGMSYVFDIYRGLRKPVTDFIDYAVFVCFFPLLVAGPIERANHLLPQVQSKRTFSYQQAVEGCRLMLWGMFKKVVIADGLALMVDEVFNNYNTHSAFSLIIGAIGFSFQIYGDFSGYSDIAIGTAKLFGFELLSNFRFPYFSRDISEFWRRWHMSLTSWFKDYLYIPLGGSKGGLKVSIRNTFIIFLVSGFWHGASWNFIIWGGIHACGFLPLLISNKNRRYVQEVVAQSRKLPNLREFWQMTTTFAFVTFAWVFFRLYGFTDSFHYFKRIFENSIKQPSQFLAKPYGFSTLLVYSLPLIIIDWSMRRNERRVMAVKSKMLNWGISFLIAFFVLNAFIAFKKNPTQFIYFKF